RRQPAYPRFTRARQQPGWHGSTQRPGKALRPGINASYLKDRSSPVRRAAFCFLFPGSAVPEFRIPVKSDMVQLFSLRRTDGWTCIHRMVEFIAGVISLFI